MFDYNLLDDLEFESLARDIMSRKLDKELYKFPRGRDGGIDICDDNFNPKTIIQVKHYINSGASNLIRSLDKEKEKVQNLNPENYYIFTSLGLTHQRRKEIIEMFPNYMSNLKNVITKDEIDDFLNDPLNIDVLNKHYKLWIQSVNILSIFQKKALNKDSYALLSDIEDRKGIYVKTSIYEKALKKLNDNDILLLLGNPGIGKTTLCEMIVLEYLKNDYQVIYASTNDLTSVKESIMDSRESKQIILLDDFLGHHYLKIDDTKSSELKMLIATIKRLDNTKLLLNSRRTILNDAVQSDFKFKELYDNYRDNELKIDQNSISFEERYNIFKNHLTYNGVSQSYREYLMDDDRYLKIIDHKNFNPRIIEYVANNRNTIGETEESYYSFILSKLDNPKDVWQDEFENRIEPIDRIFLYTLHSISEGKAISEDIKLAFEKRISNETYIDNTINNYERVTKRLSNSLIRITEGFYGLEVSIINPSLSEYIHQALQENIEEQRKILKYSYFYDQIVQTVNHPVLKNDRIDKLFEENILDYQTLSEANDIFSFFLNEVTRYKINDTKLTKQVRISLNNISKKYYNSNVSMAKAIDKLITNKKFEIYKVSDALVSTNNLENILSYIDNREYLIFLFNKYYFSYNYLPYRFERIFRERFNQIILPLLTFIFRVESFGLNLDDELKSVNYNTENIVAKNNLLDDLYEKAKNILNERIVLEYMDTRFENPTPELDQLVNKILDKEDIRFAVQDHLEIK